MPLADILNLVDELLKTELFVLLKKTDYSDRAIKNPKSIGYGTSIGKVLGLQSLEIREFVFKLINSDILFSIFYIFHSPRDSTRVIFSKFECDEDGRIYQIFDFDRHFSMEELLLENSIGDSLKQEIMMNFDLFEELCLLCVNQ